ncbi:MAG: Scr1 family TA system antitoxin-like transcriptional regulator [Sciscionella sp.]
MVATNSPTVLKRWIAFELRRLREETGRSRQEAAERVDEAPSQIGHPETMRNLPSASDLEVLLTWYGHPERFEFFRDLLTHPGFVYVETTIKGVYYEGPDDIRTYRNGLSRLRVKAADQDASREVIAQAMKEL